MENTNTKFQFLEMIQRIISRMSTNSFLLKGWSITLVAGMIALSSNDSSSRFIFLVYLPIVLFWFLDSYYLQLERKYRLLYSTTAEKSGEEIDFRLTISPSSILEGTQFHQSLFSRTEICFYAPIVIAIAIVTMVYWFKYEKQIRRGERYQKNINEYKRYCNK